LTSGQGGLGDDSLPSGALDVQSGALVLSADTTFAGEVTIGSGTLVLDAAGAAGSSANTYDVALTEVAKGYTVSLSQSTHVKPSAFALSADKNGDTLVSYPTPPTAPTPYDFHGDGLSDILFRDAASGETYLWEMNGTNVINGGLMGAQVGNNCQIGDVGDFNGDGKADILFQQCSSGLSYIWEMKGATVTSGGLTRELTALGWTVQNGAHVQG